MGWNGSGTDLSDKGVRPESSRDRRGGAVRKSRAIYAVAGLLAVACLVLVIFSVSDEKTDSIGMTDKAMGKVREMPAARPTVAVSQTNEASAHAKSVTTNTNGYYRDKNGTLRRPGGMRVVEGPVIKGVLPEDKNPPLFRTGVENEIWTLLTLPAGTVRFGGGRPYSPQFEADLRSSMKLGDQINPDDTESVKEQKRLVWEAKQDLIERMDSGEKLKDIIKESQAEMQRCAIYRQNLLKDIDKALNDESFADKDITDYISAANEIFKDNGMKPLNIKNTLLRRKLLFESKKRRNGK